MDQEWLKTQFRAHPDKSKAELATATGLSASAVSKILAGTRQIKAAEYAAMRRFFGLPVDGERALSGAARYVLEPLDLRDGADQSADNWVMPASLLRGHTKAPPDKIRIFAVQDNAMAPDFKMGEQVLVDLSDRTPSPPGVFVAADGLGGHIIRLCAPASGAIRLTTVTGKFEPIIAPLERAGLIGRVIAKLEWL